jgi:hypothetical protein
MKFRVDKEQQTLYRFNIEWHGLDLYYLNDQNQIWFDEISFEHFLRTNQSTFKITNTSVNSDKVDSSLHLFQNHKISSSLNERIYVACDNSSSDKYLVTTSELLTFTHFFDGWNIHLICSFNSHSFLQLNNVKAKFNHYSQIQYTSGEVLILVSENNDGYYDYKNLKEFWRFVRIRILRIGIEAVIVNVYGSIYFLLTLCFDLRNWFKQYMKNNQNHAPIFLTSEQKILINNVNFNDQQYSIHDASANPELEILLLDFFKDIKIFREHHQLISI